MPFAPIPLRRRIAWWFDEHGVTLLIAGLGLSAMATGVVVHLANRDAPAQPTDPNAWITALAALGVWALVTRPTDYARGRDVDALTAEVRRLREEISSLRAEVRRANGSR